MCSKNDTLDQHDRALENSDLDMAWSKDVFYAKKDGRLDLGRGIPRIGLYTKKLEQLATTKK